jgi:hypothetical protein
LDGQVSFLGESELAGELRGMSQRKRQGHGNEGYGHHLKNVQHSELQFGLGIIPQSYPPAIAPTMRKGSAPVATGSGSGVSTSSWDRSCSQAKNRRKARRSWVT